MVFQPVLHTSTGVPSGTTSSILPERGFRVWALTWVSFFPTPVLQASASLNTGQTAQTPAGPSARWTTHTAFSGSGAAVPAAIVFQKAATNSSLWRSISPAKPRIPLWKWSPFLRFFSSIPLRKSVYPQAMYTFSAPVKSLSMTSPPGAAPAAWPDPLPCKPGPARR